MWIAIAVTCSECGNEKAIQAFSEKPSDKQISELKDSLGGMWCIESVCVEVQPDGEAAIVEGEEY